jgi:hypothetical protein
MSQIFLRAAAGITTHTARIKNSLGVVIGDPIALTATSDPAYYSGAIPSSLAAGIYSVEAYQGSEYIGSSPLYWDGNKEITPFDLDTLLKATATTTQLNAVQTNIIDAIPGQVDLTSLQNDLSLIATTSQVNAARDAVIAHGDAEWVGGGAAVDLTPLQNAVAQVLTQATQARKASVNNVAVNLTTGVITIFEDDGTTPFIRFQGTNAQGQPSATAAIRRERI